MNLDLNAVLPQAVEGLFNDLLEMPVSVKGQTAHSVRASTCVHIMGSCNAIVLVSACNGSSKALASKLLETPQSDISDADEVDSLAEFGNVLAGNIKGMFEGESVLSLPVVAFGAAIEVPAVRAQTTCTVETPGGGALTVSILGNVATDQLPDSE